MSSSNTDQREMSPSCGVVSRRAVTSDFEPLAPSAQTIFLTGPTGSGKTALGVALAERLGAEIVSMDSMAIYRHLDIGTAKPSIDDRRRVVHHLVDAIEPWEEFSLAEYLAAADRAVREIHARGRVALFVGGTPLYLKSLLRGASSGPPPNPELRTRLEQEAARAGTHQLHRRLAEVDPRAAERISSNDLRRIVRALEVFEQTGKPISASQIHFRRPPRESAAVLCLDLSRDVLYQRINERVERLFAAGLVEEVASLLRLDQPLSRTARQALGYKEVIAHLSGDATLATTIELVQRHSRQFAKRQLTWFRSVAELRWMRVSADASAAANQLLAELPITPAESPTP